MDVNPDFEEALLFLNQEKVRYLIVGAYAVIHHTEPRYTKDIGVWVETTESNAARVYRALAKFGAPLREMTPQDFATPNMVCQIGMEPNRVDIIMSISGLTFARAWKNRVITKYGRARVPVLCLEDALRAKRAAGRPHDLKDIATMEEAHQMRARTKTTRPTPRRRRT